MFSQEDICVWFKDLEGHLRIEVMCDLLDSCLPLELRFLGTYLEYSAGKHYTHLQKWEKDANIDSVTDLSDLIDTNIRRRLCITLALLHSHNRTMAAKLFSVLSAYDLKIDMDCEDSSNENDHSDECSWSELSSRNEIKLLLTMGSFHPAFDFNQRRILREKLVEFSSEELVSRRDYNHMPKQMAAGVLPSGDRASNSPPLVMQQAGVAVVGTRPSQSSHSAVKVLDSPRGYASQAPLLPTPSGTYAPDACFPVLEPFQNSYPLPSAGMYASPQVNPFLFPNPSLSILADGEPANVHACPVKSGSYTQGAHMVSHPGRVSCSFVQNQSSARISKNAINMPVNNIILPPVHSLPTLPIKHNYPYAPEEVHMPFSLAGHTLVPVSLHGGSLHPTDAYQPRMSHRLTPASVNGMRVPDDVSSLSNSYQSHGNVNGHRSVFSDAVSELKPFSERVPQGTVYSMNSPQPIILDSSIVATGQTLRFTTIEQPGVHDTSYTVIHVGGRMQACIPAHNVSASRSSAHTSVTLHSNVLNCVADTTLFIDSNARMNSYESGRKMGSALKETHALLQASTDNSRLNLVVSSADLFSASMGPVYSHLSTHVAVPNGNSQAFYQQAAGMQTASGFVHPALNSFQGPSRHLPYTQQPRLPLQGTALLPVSNHVSFMHHRPELDHKDLNRVVLQPVRIEEGDKKMISPGLNGVVQHMSVQTVYVSPPAVVCVTATPSSQADVVDQARLSSPMTVCSIYQSQLLVGSDLTNSEHVSTRGQNKLSDASLSPPSSPSGSPVPSSFPSPLPSPIFHRKSPVGFQGSRKDFCAYASTVDWLKSLRLHKYSDGLGKFTFQEMCYFTERDLIPFGLTKGARSKFMSNIHMLRKKGFREFGPHNYADTVSQQSAYVESLSAGALTLGPVVMPTHLHSASEKSSSKSAEISSLSSSLSSRSPSPLSGSYASDMLAPGSQHAAASASDPLGVDHRKALPLVPISSPAANVSEYLANQRYYAKEQCADGGYVEIGDEVIHGAEEAEEKTLDLSSKKDDFCGATPDLQGNQLGSNSLSIGASPTCYNCGFRGHYGDECHEQTMEALTYSRYAYHLDYSLGGRSPSAAGDVGNGDDVRAR